MKNKQSTNAKSQVVDDKAAQSRTDAAPEYYLYENGNITLVRKNKEALIEEVHDVLYEQFVEKVERHNEMSHRIEIKKRIESLVIAYATALRNIQKDIKHLEIK